MTARSLAPRITEAEWQEQVIELARMLGWQHMHVRRSIGKGRRWTTATNVDGWPDLTLIRPTDDYDGEIIFVELKAQNGIATDEQLAVHDMLRKAGHDAYVWRPSDLDAANERLSMWRRGWRP